MRRLRTVAVRLRRVTGKKKGALSGERPGSNRETPRNGRNPKPSPPDIPSENGIGPCRTIAAGPDARNPFALSSGPPDQRSAGTAAEPDAPEGTGTDADAGRNRTSRRAPKPARIRRTIRNGALRPERNAAQAPARDTRTAVATDALRHAHQVDELAAVALRIVPQSEPAPDGSPRPTSPRPGNRRGGAVVRTWPRPPRRRSRPSDAPARHRPVRPASGGCGARRGSL